jgi:hypothetical protein
MSRTSLVVAAALAAPTLAWAQAPEPVPRSAVGLPHPAGTIWRGSVALAPCARPALRRLILARLTPPVRTAAQERDGELVGEFLAPAPMMAEAARTAQACAAAAASPALLLDGGRSWPAFHQAFAACMAAQHAETFIGGMTLWVDNRCDW